MDSLELSPISLIYVGEPASDDMDAPTMFFRRTDGTVVTLAQLGLSQQRTESPQGEAYPTLIYQTDTPMPVEEFASVILGDTEFPLDGSAPFPAEVDEKLYPFEIGLLRYPVLDVGERNYVADVADLCQKRGGNHLPLSDVETIGGRSLACRKADASRRHSVLGLGTPLRGSPSRVCTQLHYLCLCSSRVSAATALGEKCIKLATSYIPSKPRAQPRAWQPTGRVCALFPLGAQPDARRPLGAQ